LYCATQDSYLEFESCGVLFIEVGRAGQGTTSGGANTLGPWMAVEGANDVGPWQVKALEALARGSSGTRQLGGHSEIYP
jgi:hypothetical protein